MPVTFGQVQETQIHVQQEVSVFVGEAIETYKQNVISRPMPKIIFGIVADNNRKSLVFVNVRLYFACFISLLNGRDLEDA